MTIESTKTSTEQQAFIARCLTHEADAIARIAQSVGDEYDRAVELVVNCANAGGTVLVSGLGKSGHIGAKISATLASLGITSHAVHPTEAAHGDLGRFRKHDLAICLSHSGETEELVSLAAILRQDGIPIIAITRGLVEGKPESSLMRLATVTLQVGVVDEAGDGSFLAPTTSTTAALAIADAIALAAARARSFTAEDFHRRHPGGQLGSMLRPITELLRFHAGKNLPIAKESDALSASLQDASKVVRRPGALLVVDHDGKLSGIFTDSDLRRLVLRDPSELAKPMHEAMSRDPRSLPATALVRDAVAMFREHRTDEIPVVDRDGRPIGLLDVQDLITMKLVEGND